MADQATETATKAVEGSFEQLRESIVVAIRQAGLFGGDFYVTNTLADLVTVCTYGIYGTKPMHWSVPYAVDANGAITLGTPTKIAIIEVIVPADGGAAASEATSDEGGEYSDDDVAGKSGGSLQYKTVDFDVKGVAEETINGVKGWTFEGYASVWDVVDRENDVTIKGCFARSLADGLPITKYEHGPTIGKYLEAKEDDHGLWLKGFVPEDPATELVHKLMKIGAVAKMSIGWRPYPGGMTKRADGVRELRSVMLPEASPVGVPMLPATSIDNVKSAGALPDAKFDERIEAATAALNEAVSDAGALVSRRTAQDRAPSAKSLDAVAALAVASGDAMLGLLGVEAKAGRALSGVRKRHLADLAKAVAQAREYGADGERKEIEALIDDAGGGDAETGGGKAAPNAGGAAGAARRREAELYELKLARYARQAPVPETLGVTP